VKGIIVFVMVIDPYNANYVWYTAWLFGGIMLVLILVLHLTVLLLLPLLLLPLGITCFSFMGL
jgi:hypothetical protein